jgi:hypothetical protein
MDHPLVLECSVLEDATDARVAARRNEVEEAYGGNCRNCDEA